MIAPGTGRGHESCRRRSLPKQLSLGERLGRTLGAMIPKKKDYPTGPHWPQNRHNM